MKPLFIALIFFSGQLNAQCVLKTASLGNFKTIKGKEILNCSIAYRTLGKINADKSNVVLWPTWFTGKSSFICNGVASMMMDTTGLYIIVVDALGNGVSSSPSNNRDFPEITIRDMVNSQNLLLTKHLGIHSVKAIIGISMGGFQTLEWLVAYPSFADKAVSIIGSPKPTIYDLMFYKTEESILINAEQNKASKDLALRLVSNVHLLNLRTPSYWLGSSKSLNVDSLMLAEQENNLRSMKADDWLCQLKAIIGHDIYKSSGKALKDMRDVIRTKTLMIISKSDHMVNPSTSLELSNTIGATLIQLDNNCGHLGPFCDNSIVKEEVTRFLQK